MDNLFCAAKTFENILEKNYLIKLGIKRTLIEINLKFSEDDFHHLIGIHKLKDLSIAREKRSSVFKKILNGDITLEKISKSNYFADIEERLKYFSKIETYLDSNDLIVNFANASKKDSIIDADFLLSIIDNDKNIYFFIKKTENNYSCISFFPEEKKDYLVGRKRIKQLQKIKFEKSSSSSLILIDRLKTYESDYEKELRIRETVLEIIKCNNKMIEKRIHDFENITNKKFTMDYYKNTSINKIFGSDEEKKFFHQIVSLLDQTAYLSR